MQAKKGAAASKSAWIAPHHDGEGGVAGAAVPARDRGVQHADPRSFPRTWSRWASAGEEVVMSMASAPGLAWAKTPSAPVKTASTSLG